MASFWNLDLQEPRERHNQVWKNHSFTVMDLQVREGGARCETQLSPTNEPNTDLAFDSTYRGVTEYRL